MDQFISSSESKWQRMSGLVMLLPHGYEGQGPEHSSARLERYLQLCAEYNMTVANCTTPANFFHLIRRQLARPFRKPLVVMSPKSLLRHPECVSTFEEFTEGTAFQEVIDDAAVGARSGKKIRRVVFCTGKLYFDLLQRKREGEHTDVAVVRVEQLYPFPAKQLKAIAQKYSEAEYCWAQEEPANMGAWQYIQSMNLSEEMGLQIPLRVISRRASASPATGFKKIHDQQQAAIVEAAFAKS